MATEIIRIDFQNRIRVLDRLTIVAPLGLRFHDAATGETVGDGLNVRAYPADLPNATRSLFPNRRGIYVLHDAPGLRNLQNGTGDDEYWNNLPPKKDFVIEVSDDQGRFVGFKFTAALPARGIYEWSELSPASPPSATRSIPLFSSPARTAPAGMAIVRADLWDPTRGSQGAPAAFAVLELHDNDRLVTRGLADQEGRVGLMFPYPAPKAFPPSSPPASPIGSPPAANGPALTDQFWPFRVRALYGIQSPPPAPATDSAPDLRTALSQPAATLWANEERTDELLEVAVPFGQPLILKSRPPSMSPPLKGGSMLFITPAV
jgi:hypothetical protein